MTNPGRSVFALAAMLAIAACAVRAPDTRIANLEEVVQSGRVSPVDGITVTGQPSQAALTVFSANGYRTVIDLRTDGEDRGYDEKAAVEAAGMRYVSLPISVRDGLTFDRALALDEILAATPGPVLLHCGSGNRAGSMLALRASAMGASVDEALAIGRASGMTSLEDKVRAELKKQASEHD